MAITDKTRKMLWGRSGNRCAICKTELVQLSGQPDEHAIVGDECHIVARSRDGARGEHHADAADVDGYDNLILLCPTDHRIVDGRPNAYPPEALVVLKQSHENWVQDSLMAQSQGRVMPRIDTGSEFVAVAYGGNSVGYTLDRDHPVLVEEERLTDWLGDMLEDYGWRSWNKMTSEQRQDATDAFDTVLKRLSAVGWVVVGERLPWVNANEEWAHFWAIRVGLSAAE